MDNQQNIFGNHSVPSPLQAAGNSTLNYLEINSQLPSLDSLVDCNTTLVSQLYPGHLVTVKLLLMYSMRSVELLRLTVVDMLSPTMFFIEGAKRSHSYQITIPLSKASLNMIHQWPSDRRLFPFTYHQVWSAMRRVGLMWSRSNRVVSVVTHQGRYLLADKLSILNKQSAIQGCLHHKSEKSAAYYTRDLAKTTPRSYALRPKITP